MKTIILSYFILLPTLTICQGLDSQIEKIAIENKVFGQYIGIVGTPTEQYKRFEEVKDKATKEQLAELTDHSNAVVRCYAFWALADRKEDNLFEILLKHLNDTITIHKQFADVLEYMTVADFYIDLLTSDYIFADDYQRVNNSRLTDDELMVLDSIVLYSPYKLDYQSTILKKINPKEIHYNRIKELSTNGVLNAFPALARYQKSQDLSIILSLKDFPTKQNMYPHPKEELFKAIEVYPDEFFLDYLDEFGYSIATQRGWIHTWIYYYRAVAAYKSQESLRILMRPFENSEMPLTYHLRFVNNALDQYPDPIYKDLIATLWLDHNHIGESSFKYMRSVDPELAFKIVQSYLDDFEQVYSGASEDKMIPIILPFAFDYDSVITIKLIAKNLKTNTVTPFKQFIPFASKLKKKEFIEPLFYRIENEWNGYVFYDAVKLIASYKDPQLTGQILPRAKKNKKITNKYSSRKDVEARIKEIIEIEKSG